jgi:hypothetical protein
VEEYDQLSLFPMFLKCYHILHPMAEFEHVANMQIDEESSLDIFWNVCWNEWTNEGGGEQGVIDV